MNISAKHTIRRRVAAVLALAACTTATSSHATDDDAYRSIEALRQAYVQGTFTPVDMTRLFLGRVESIDCADPTLNAVIETNPDAIPSAQAAARDYATGSPKPLGGIPILLKDNIDTGDRMRTSAGSLAFDGPAPRDATVAAKLREAGAVILGKANLSEWSNFRSVDATNGWSARGGFTRHPYILDRDPLGSSSGSAAAVAAGLATVAIGTETSGSIVSPAETMGLVGIKPTVGLVSRAGIIPISLVQDTAGPIARSVADAAAVLTAIAGSDPADPVSARADLHKVDYTRFRDVRGMRIGVVRDRYARRQKNASIEQAIRLLEGRGAVIVDSLPYPSVDQAQSDHYSLLLSEFRHAIEAYLSLRGEPSFKTLDDLIAFNERESGTELRHFGQDLFLAARDAPSVNSAQYKQARARANWTTGPKGIDDLLARHKLDALLGSSSMVDVAAMSGRPIVTVPTHFDGELPVGVHIFGKKWSERSLISIAAAIESEANAFRRPKFLPTLPVR